MASSRWGSVYIAKRDDGKLKIGRSKFTPGRIRNVSNNKVFGGSFEHFYERIFDDCIQAEKEVHEIFNEYHLGHEIFDIDPEIAKKALIRTGGIDEMDYAREFAYQCRYGKKAQ
jgi:hypothetical protein